MTFLENRLNLPKKDGCLQKTARIHPKTNRWLFPLGLLIVCAYFLPNLILGEHFSVNYHDQLDGEVLAYMLQAKHLFSGSGVFPELMNGIPSAGLTPPAPFGVLLYRLFPPVAAFVLMQFLAMLAAYIGMFLCIRAFTGSEWISLFVAGLYAFLPVRSVYGLSLLGLPLVFWAFDRLYHMPREAYHASRGYDDARGATASKRGSAAALFPLLAIVCYTGFSSFVLIGFGVVGLAWLFGLFLLCRKENAKPVFLGAALMTLLYLLLNFSLLRQTLGLGTAFLSHREEFVIHASGFWSSFRQVLLYGGEHADSFHLAILIFSTLMLAYGLSLRRPLPRHYRFLALAYAAAVLLALFHALWVSQPVAGLRGSAGGFWRSFQANRLTWLSPMCWYFMLGLCLSLTKEELSALQADKGRLLFLKKGLFLAAAISAVCFTGFSLLYTNFLRYNVKKLLLPDSDFPLTWFEYYAPDLFDQVKDITGHNQEEYRVVSLGIYPAAALFNGFYCLDGYSNNYPLSYKEEFRRIIAPELEKSEALRLYYDDWGSRCYFFSAELGTYSLVSKHSGVVIQSLDVDTKQLEAMGAKYLISAVRLGEGHESFRLLTPEPIRSDESYFELYVYEIAHSS
ncbi:MAG: DUF6044 family protein [Clostridium sp.]|jgi:hypothetical protein|nr:DUF6044 family protein [Clostridium sp.]